ncbi:outer membrane beta-barrel protein [Sphingomonas sp. GC_Shp_3]|uniref:outer membrane beta-barrel protein n=1 Tax=Sphingomonas sp. GC_Shp_3 TaxID=2937383 RepID=UPI00226A4208|nr:outer membrane beta-barrel protein [Sphingomonas sp. GC_Shp_3]
MPVLVVGSAQAQVGESLLLPPVIPPGFDRGRNQSVLELPRKAYDPVGIRINSFDLFPSIKSGAGATSNTYYTVDPVASTFLTTTPAAELISRWSRHQLMLSGTGTFRQYIGQPRRNETTWQTDARGRVDLGRFTTVTLEEISAQLTENQFSGETAPTVAALSRYRRDFVSLRAVNQVGRMRLTVATDYALFCFKPLPLLAGGIRSQENRDRNVARATGQFEYARSPDLAFFVQASYADQAFKTRLSATLPNLDSTAYRVLSGFNFDDPGFARGSLGVGYTHQTFTAPNYKPVGGVSVEARVEVFPSRLTTVLLGARRTLEVTSLYTGGAYWNNQLTLRVDREIWHSVLVDVIAERFKQSYIQSGLIAKSYQLGLGAQYLSSRRVMVDASLKYGNRSAASAVLGNPFDEIRSEIGLTFRI